jgi:hypothetical protein
MLRLMQRSLHRAARKRCIDESSSNLYLLMQKCKLKKLILIFDEKIESGARYMAPVTCDLIKFEFNF